MKRLLVLAVVLAVGQTALGQGFGEAMRNRDFKALQEYYSAKSDTISYDGTVCRGWNEIREDLAKRFAEQKGEHTVNDFWSMRSLSDEISLFHGIWEIVDYEKADEPDVTRAVYATIRERESGIRLCYRVMVPTKITPDETGPMPDLVEIKGLSDPAAVKIANELNRQFSTAFVKQDIETLVKTFDVDGALRTSRGTELLGSGAIERMYQVVFTRNPTARSELSTNSARFLTPDILVTDGVVKRRGYTEDRPEKGCFFRVSTKKDGQWRTKLYMAWVPYVPLEDTPK